MGGLDNPSYEQNFIQSKQSNNNTKHVDLPKDQYSISVNINLKAMTSNSQVNDTSSGVPSFIYQNDTQIEGIYSLANNEQVGEGLYNHLKRN